MEIKRAGSQPSAKGPSEWFTSVVRIDPVPSHKLQVNAHTGNGYKEAFWKTRAKDESENHRINTE